MYSTIIEWNPLSGEISEVKQPRKPKLTRGAGHMGKPPTPPRPQHIPDPFAKKKPPRMR